MRSDNPRGLSTPTYTCLDAETTNESVPYVEI